MGIMGESTAAQRLDRSGWSLFGYVRAEKKDHIFHPETGPEQAVKAIQQARRANRLVETQRLRAS